MSNVERLPDTYGDLPIIAIILSHPPTSQSEPNGGRAGAGGHDAYTGEVRRERD